MQSGLQNRYTQPILLLLSPSCKPHAICKVVSTASIVMPLHWIQMHTHSLRCLKKCVVQRSIWLAFLSNTAAGCTAEQVFRWQHGGEHAAGKLVHCHHSAAAPTYHCISMIILPIHAVNQRCHARLVALAILGHLCLQPINLHSDQPQDNSRTFD